MAGLVRAQKVSLRKQCAILRSQAFRPCNYGENCYRTNPSHVMHCHIMFKPQSSQSDLSHVPKEKPKSLTKGRNIKTLFHQTSLEGMKAIIDGDYKWAFSDKNRLFGQGIYFSETAEHTKSKAHHHGVIFCAEVDLGTVHTTNTHLFGHTLEDHHQKFGCNTIYAPAGIEWGQGTGIPRTLSNPEYIILNTKQILRGCWKFVNQENDVKWEQLKQNDK